MRLYNTLSREVEDIKPLSPPSVTVYTCGPTVYDYPHIGNWFTFIRYDVLVRALSMSGLKPKWVMNITDVGHLVSDADEGEDKLEKGAKREGKTAWDIAKYYGDYFTQGLERLNITPPTHLPKATDHITEQIALIKRLEQKGFTYVIDDGVYYDTAKFPKYADFARLDLDEQQAGARVEYNKQKRNLSDFALWKFSPKDAKRDMEWESPWGRGFPGWHIECSAMGMKYLGETIDIHCGGIDHVPVHHTNEIAQSEAITQKPLANIWMHANHILIDDLKISKSLGNVINLEDIEEKGVSLGAFRLHVLESHYRSQSKFSWDSLEAAQNRLKNWRATAALALQPRSSANDDLDFGKSIKYIRDSILNDLNTPEVLSEINSLFAKIETNLVHPNQAPAFNSYIQELENSLGLLIHVEDITDFQKQLIAKRDEVRAEQQWIKSDELRDVLAKQNIGLRDTPHGTVWFRT